jgi:hypothetical protein
MSEHTLSDGGNFFLVWLSEVCAVRRALLGRIPLCCRGRTGPRTQKLLAVLSPLVRLTGVLWLFGRHSYCRVEVWQVCMWQTREGIVIVMMSQKKIACCLLRY